MALWVPPLEHPAATGPPGYPEPPKGDWACCETEFEFEQKMVAIQLSWYRLGHDNLYRATGMPWKDELLKRDNEYYVRASLRDPDLAAKPHYPPFALPLSSDAPDVDPNPYINPFTNHFIPKLRQEPVWKDWFGRVREDRNVDKLLDGVWSLDGAQRGLEDTAYFGMRARLLYKRMLGWGGFGAALQFEVLGKGNRPMTPRKYLAVKMAIDVNNAETMGKEKKIMRKLRRAPHIIQRLFRRDVDLPPPRSGVDIFDDAYADWDDYSTEPAQSEAGDDDSDKENHNSFQDPDNYIGEDDQGELIEERDSDDEADRGRYYQRHRRAWPVAVMEWVSRGSLSQYLRREGDVINRDPDALRAFSPEVCWSLLSCLVDACIAMKYNPRDGSKPRKSKFGPDLPEVIPADPNRPNEPRDVVHLDLDCFNVFVGDFDDGEHRDVPRLKIADFGLAQDVDARVQWQNPDHRIEKFWAGLIAFVHSRASGKKGYCLPEQYTIEWERYSHHPHYPYANWPDLNHNEIPGAHIAGQYGETSNVFHVGLLLWAIMMSSEPTMTPSMKMVKLRQSLGPQGGGRNEYQGEDGENMEEDDDDAEDAPEGSYQGTYVEGLCCGWQLESNPRAANYPLRLREVVMRCMMYEPRNRPSLKELREEMDQFLAWRNKKRHEREESKKRKRDGADDGNNRDDDNDQHGKGRGWKRRLRPRTRVEALKQAAAKNKSKPRQAKFLGIEKAKEAFTAPPIPDGVETNLYRAGDWNQHIDLKNEILNFFDVANARGMGFKYQTPTASPPRPRKPGNA